jgi:hypothetical protein
MPSYSPTNNSNDLFYMDEKNYIQIMIENSSTWIKKLKNKKNKKENLENPITKIK